MGRSAVVLTMGVLLVALLAALPAQAGDEDAKRIADLQTKVARMEAEAKHLRKANETLAANATRAQRALVAMTASLQASTVHTKALQDNTKALKERVKMLETALEAKPADDPARLQYELLKMRQAHGRDMSAMQDKLNAARANEAKAKAALADVQARAEREVATLQAKVSKLEAQLAALRKNR